MFIVIVIVIINFTPKKNSNYQISYLNKKKKDKIILCIKPSHTLNELIVYIYIYMMLPGWVGFRIPLHRKYIMVA